MRKLTPEAHDRSGGHCSLLGMRGWVGVHRVPIRNGRQQPLNWSCASGGLCPYIRLRNVLLKNTICLICSGNIDDVIFVERPCGLPEVRKERKWRGI